MKVLVDTNVILDILLDRKPFVDQAAYVLSKIESGELQGFLCATTLTTIHYMLRKAVGSRDAIKQIKTLMKLFDIAKVNRIVLENAIDKGFTDFEDSVLHEAAIHAGAEYIVTRNISDFKKADIPVYTPQEFINMFLTVRDR